MGPSLTVAWFNMKQSPYCFAFCVNDNYVPYATVAIKSILANCSVHPLRIYVLIDYISPSKRKMLSDVHVEYSFVDVRILHVNNNWISGLTVGKWTIHSWYRILLPALLPEDIDRVLYLDADTLVLRPLDNLFEMEMEGVSIAGGLDPLSFQDSTYIRCQYESRLQYVCSGILMLNLKYWREHNLAGQIRNYAIDHCNSLKFPDQDSINYVCRHDKKVLPLKYSFMEWYYTDKRAAGTLSREECIDGLESTHIVHFAGNNPWFKEYSRHLFHSDWRKINKTLKHPVRRKYSTRGWLLIKLLVWEIVHLRRIDSMWPTKEDILRDLYNQPSRLSI